MCVVKKKIRKNEKMTQKKENGLPALKNPIVQVVQLHPLL
jgi:hypothetical protein